MQLKPFNLSDSAYHGIPETVELNPADISSIELAPDGEPQWDKTTADWKYIITMTGGKEFIVFIPKGKMESFIIDRNNGCFVI